ncbi:MAG: nucleoside deaminase [Clostridia bacterium]|nr:nucleoside deaminase [Clostridia bacterium]
MDTKFMELALLEARKAFAIDETPVGCVIVRDGKVIAKAYNKRETKKNALCHAEIIAINKACKKLGGWRLLDCDMYVTLEPCPMCMGAIIASRIENVYFGAYDKKAGALGSVCNLSDMFPHKVAFLGGVMESECSEILTRFFKELRKRNS